MSGSPSSSAFGTKSGLIYKTFHPGKVVIAAALRRVSFRPKPPMSHTEPVAVSAINRSQLVMRGRTLEYFTVGYNTLEGLVSIIAGLIAGSVSLVGFGFDSLIEVTSGTALLWRLRHDWNGPPGSSRADHVEDRWLVFRRPRGLCCLRFSADRSATGEI